jgi:hypothetical protein
LRILNTEKWSIYRIEIYQKVGSGVQMTDLTPNLAGLRIINELTKVGALISLTLQPDRPACPLSNPTMN